MKNGLSVARFVPNAYLRNTSMAAQAACTIFIVLVKRSAPSGTNHSPFGIGSAQTSQVFTNSGSSATAYCYYSTQAAGVQVLGGTAATWGIMVLRVNSAASLDFYQSGGTPTNFNPSDGITTATSYNYGFNGVGSHGDFDIGEAIAYDSALSAADMNLIGDWLGTKLGDHLDGGELMTQPTPSSALATPSHSTLHNEYVDVKMFGAVGDGVADDTAAIQAAIEAAGSVGAAVTAGSGCVFFPKGKYLVSSTIDLNLDSSGNRGVQLIGPTPGTIADLLHGAKIVGSVNGALFARTTENHHTIVMRNLYIHNSHATGTTVSLNGLAPGTSGIYQCSLVGHTGLTFDADGTFPTVVENTQFQRAGALAGSSGITTKHHKAIINCDVVGFEIGIDADGVGVNVVGGRFENNVYGILVRGSGAGQVSGCTFEANDTAIRVGGAYGVLIAGNRAIGTATTVTTVGHSVDAYSIGASTGVHFVANTTLGSVL